MSVPLYVSWWALRPKVARVRADYVCRQPLVQRVLLKYFQVAVCMLLAPSLRYVLVLMQMFEGVKEA